MRYLTTDITLTCIHGGTITPKKPGKRSMQVDGKPVLVEGDILDATVCCPGIPTAVPPCTRVTSLLVGAARNMNVDGEAPLLDTLMVMTDQGMAVLAPSAKVKASQNSASILLPSPTTPSSRNPASAEPAQAAETEADAVQDESLSWISVQVVEQYTGARLPRVRFTIEYDGQKHPVITDEKGEIRIPNVSKNSAFTLLGLTQAEMQGNNRAWHELVCVSRELGESQHTDKDHETIAFPSNGGDLWLANVLAHKVSKQDTLDSLAENNNSDMKFIAFYNWQATNPEDINRALRDEVGCNEKDKSGKNYCFSDQDKPGYVFIPVPWTSKNAYTAGKTYRLQVQLTPAYRFSLQDEAGEPFPKMAYVIRFGNGKQEKDLHLSARGRGLHLNPPPGPVTVSYTDPVQIRAHWAARRLAHWIESIRQQDNPSETAPLESIQTFQPPPLA